MIVKDWEMLSQQQEDMNVSMFLSAQPLTRCAVIEHPTDSLIPSNPSTRSLTPLCLCVFLCHSFCWSIPLSSLYFSFSFLSTSSCFFTIQDSEGPYNWLSRLVRNIFVSRSIRKKKPTSSVKASKCTLLTELSLYLYPTFFDCLCVCLTFCFHFYLPLWICLFLILFLSLGLHVFIFICIFLSLSLGEGGCPLCCVCPFSCGRWTPCAP